MAGNTSDIIAATLIFVIGYALGRVSKTLETVRESRARWQPVPHVDEAHIETAVRAGKKIDAIRLYRQRTGAGVKEAKRAGHRSTGAADQRAFLTPCPDSLAAKKAELTDGQTTRLRTQKE